MNVFFVGITVNNSCALRGRMEAASAFPPSVEPQLAQLHLAISATLGSGAATGHLDLLIIGGARSRVAC